MDAVLLPLAITFVSFSAPITASIIVRGRSTNGNTNGKYVTTREHDAYKADMGDRLNRIESKLDALQMFIKSRL